MLRIYITLVIAWLFEAGRNAYIEDRDIETNLYCDVARSNLMHTLGFENF